MTSSPIVAAEVTPVAFRDPPLLNATGVHQPWALRAIVVLRAEDGTVGLGETYGDDEHVARLERAAAALVGADAADLDDLRARIEHVTPTSASGHGMAWMLAADAVGTIVAPFEMAALDLHGRRIDAPASELLGGRIRTRIDVAGYLFAKLAGHPGEAHDDWGEALDADALVAQARRMADRWGFRSWKLKAGALPPSVDVATIQALADAFPGAPLRLDPNAAWTLETAASVAAELEQLLEYLEDPVAGIDGMAAMRQHTALPLATNMCVTRFEHLAPAFAADAVDIVLADPHSWGGMRATTRLGELVGAAGRRLSMHSNSHLGISLAAMVHAAAAAPALDAACDTHRPWQEGAGDVVDARHLAIVDGAIAVPDRPGLGVDLDERALARMHADWRRCGYRVRDDVAYARTLDPGLAGTVPRW